MCVVLARFDGHEPSLFDEDLRQAQGRFLVSDGVGSVGIDFPRGDGGLGPMLKPVEQRLCGRRLRLFGWGWWSSFVEPLKEVHHSRSSFDLSVTAGGAFCGVASMIMTSLGSGLSNFLSPLRSMVMMNRSAAGLFSGPVAAIARNSRALSILWRGLTVSPCRMSPSTAGVSANSLCARSRAVTPLRILLVFSASIFSISASSSPKRAQVA